MTRNRDSMSVVDMIRVCTVSGAAILGSMVLLGLVMIAQKPELGLELAQSQAVPSVEMPVPNGGPQSPVRLAEAETPPAS